jgi:hypothetical protein
VETHYKPLRSMPNDRAESKNETPRRRVTVSLSALTTSVSSSPSSGYAPGPKDAVLALQDQVDVVGGVVGYQGRQPDAQVDVGPVGELGGRAGGHRVAIPGHQISVLGRTGEVHVLPICPQRAGAC